MTDDSDVTLPMKDSAGEIDGPAPILEAVPADPRFDLADLLRKLRKDKGLNQIELSERAGLGPSTVKQIEQRVSKNPDVETLRKIAKILGVDPQTFISLLPSMTEASTLALSQSDASVIDVGYILSP